MKIVPKFKSPASPLKRVNFTKWLTNGWNNDRATDLEALLLMQDSLIGRNYGLPLRLAVLATQAQEASKDGGDTRGIGGNGLLGLSFGRMPASYLGNTPKQRAKQIKFILDDLESIHPDNWSNGGSGGIYIKNALDGYDQFWDSNNVWDATLVLNKSYIRPRDKKGAWDNRSKVAKSMLQYME